MNKLNFALLFLVANTAQAFTLGGANQSSLKGWQTKELTFHLNATNCGLSQAVVEQTIADAIDVWSHVVDSSLTLKYGGTTTTTVAAATGGTASDYPVILCDANFNATTGTTGNDGVLGVGQYLTTGGTIDKGYLLLNADTTHSTTNNITTATTTTLSIIMAHEIGHVLGFGHSSDTTALMYYDASAKTRLSLAQDDADAMAYLYPRSEPSSGILGCGVLATPPTGGPWTGIGLTLFWFLLVPALALRALTPRPQAQAAA